VIDSKSRFSSRVEDYVKYRPHYPHQLIPLLKKKINIKKEWIIADIGSGTGISSELFVENGNIVYGIEPNDNMRMAAENHFLKYKNFISVKGSAENTTLDDRSVDLVITGQAFHWFDLNETKREVRRILKEKRRYAVIFWNERKTTHTRFQREYEMFLKKYCQDYGKVTQKNITPHQFIEFFGSQEYNVIRLDNLQEFDFEGLKGRLQSSSYSPDYNHKIYPEMINNLYNLFSKHSVENKVTFEYNTEIYYGKIV
jgi:ubiquinone/menaquinone biosynthesis C-methylase UbiE